jgi:hypothetical protein
MMKHSSYNHAIALVFVTPVLVAAAGCSGGGGGGQSSANDTPAAAADMMAQAGVCDALFADKAAFRAPDLRQGVLRWKCGDVAGVTPPDLGQEYCEYHAVSAGKIVDTAEADQFQGSSVSCLFTSVFADVDDGANTTIGAIATASLADSRLNNLSGFTVPTDPSVAEAKLGHMLVGFNTRGAATTLIQTCSNEGTSGGQDLVTASRVAACLQLAQSTQDANTKQALTTTCTVGLDGNGVPTAQLDDTTWAQLQATAQSSGATLDVVAATDASDAAERQRDIAACVLTGRAQGLPWRNSDPSICTRSMRAVSECKDTFNPLPTGLQGFSMRGWANPTLPTGCRHGKVWKDAQGNLVSPASVQDADIQAKKVSAQDYDQLVICNTDPNDVAAQSVSLQVYCEQKFSNDIAMQAPIGALVKTETKASTPFCQAFQTGVAAIQGGGAPQPQ